MRAHMHPHKCLWAENAQNGENRPVRTETEKIAMSMRTERLYGPIWIMRNPHRRIIGWGLTGFENILKTQPASNPIISPSLVSLFCFDPNNHSRSKKTLDP